MIKGIVASHSTVATNGSRMSSPSSSCENSSRWSGAPKIILSAQWMRFVFLDVPLLCILLTYASVQWFDYVRHHYIVPQAKLFHWTSERTLTEHTYYNRPCNSEDLSTHNVSDLFLPPSSVEPEEAAKIQLKHGFTFVENVLSRDTMNELRNHINWKNHNDKNLFVISSNHRFNILLGTEEPSVRNALEEVANHKQFRMALEAILGPNPSMVEMTAISSSAGAAAQYWHQDVNEEASAANYMQSFGPVYSVFIQLQNTTKAMGATSICPGSHYCTEGPVAAYCEAANMKAVNQFGYSGGDALIMNMNSFHRGSAHTDHDAPDRIMLILSFTPKPSVRAERRQISQGFTYQLRWDMWGHTLNDLAKANTVMRQPWATLRSLGLYKPSNAEWGVDYIMQSTQRILHRDNGFARYTLVEFLEEGGFPFLPKFLQAELAEGESWTEFLVNTLNLCVSFTTKVAAAGLIVYAVFTLLATLCAKSGRKVQRFKILMFHFISVCVVAGLFYGTARFIVDHSNWAKDIVAKQKFSTVIPYDEFIAEKNQNDSLSFRASWKRTTYPNRRDVLIESRYGSPELGIYNHFVDGHPGNVVFNEILQTYQSSDYNLYPKVLQDAASRFVTQSIATNQNGRFLYQLPNGAWGRLLYSEAELYVKHQLWLNANPHIKRVTELIRYGMSKLRYGLYRDSSLVKEHIRLFMKDLENKVLSRKLNVANIQSGANVVPVSNRPRIVRVSQRPVISSRSSQTKGTKNEPRIFEHLSESRVEPFAGAWIEEGDIVEVLYDDESDSPNFWYGAQVVHVYAYGAFKVRFADGEEKSVRIENIRRIRSLKANEVLEIYVGNDKYATVQLLEVLNDGSIRAKEETSGKIVDGITALQWRRSGGKIRSKADVFSTEFDIDVDEGDVVEVYFDADHWFTGTIVSVDAVNGENSYTVDFVDGSQYVVDEDSIRLISEYSVGEKIDIFVDDAYYPCEYLGTLPNGDYYAKCEDGDVVEGFNPVEVCRRR